MPAVAKADPIRQLVPADPQVLSAILDYYGFDFFLNTTVPMIDFNDEKYGEAVDHALDRFQTESTNFSIRRAFTSLIRDMMDEGFTREEALEELAEDGYVVPVHIAMYYSSEAGDSDIERLSLLIRNRARRMLRNG